MECVAGRGLRGDRFFDYRRNYKGQITFFSAAVFAEICRRLRLTKASPGHLRRNVVVSDFDDLNALIGETFTLQGLHFRGTAHCTPCAWMDYAYASGVHKYLSSHKAGGLRAQILTDGTLQLGEAEFARMDPAAIGQCDSAT